MASPNRQECIVGVLEGLERARISLEQWAKCPRNQVEKNTVKIIINQIGDTIRYASNIMREI